MTSLLTMFADAVARYPERTAIVNGDGHSVSFENLQNRATELAAHWFDQGVQKGDRVIIAMPVNSDLYASLAALWSLGATVVLPEPSMGLAGLRHAIKTTKPTGFCASGPYGLLQYLLPALWSVKRLRLNPRDESLPPPIDLQETDIALISFTSGTTGKPKAIPRSHGFLMAQYRAVSPLLESAKPERDLVAFPVFTLIGIASGRTSVLPNWKMSKLQKVAPAEIGAWIETQNVTRALLPPSLCEKLVQTSLPPSLRTIFTGGGPVFPDILDGLHRAAEALQTVCVYGSTEAEPIAHLDATDIGSADRSAMLSGKGLLVGRPVDAVQVRIIDHEIQVAGAHVNDGYLDAADDIENKIHDGDTIWHRTGDAGWLDNTGRLWLLGRIGSDVVIDGVRLFPFAVEVAARQWDGVVRCALMSDKDGALLVVEGDKTHQSDWEKRANEFGITTVKHLSAIPMDKRHASKVDRVALQKKLS